MGKSIQMKKNEVTILGAGLIGSLMAIYLKRQGLEVSIYDKRPDKRKTPYNEAGRSINMALSHRGWKSLEQVGLREKVEPLAIPMYGRKVHDEHGGTKFIPYGKADQAPEGEVPPANRIECMVALDGSTAAQSLSTIANLRVDQGFVCGVDGYPESECAPVVELPVIESPALESIDLAEPTLSSEANSSSGPPISLIAFAITLLAALMGIALLLTRKKART